MCSEAFSKQGQFQKGCIALYGRHIHIRAAHSWDLKYKLSLVPRSGIEVTWQSPCVQQEACSCCGLQSANDGHKSTAGHHCSHAERSMQGGA